MLDRRRLLAEALNVATIAAVVTPVVTVARWSTADPSDDPNALSPADRRSFRSDRTMASAGDEPPPPPSAGSPSSRGRRRRRDAARTQPTTADVDVAATETDGPLGAQLDRRDARASTVR